eukprot:CAMPEP_0185723716 /NCGR_PEP_ID=MMETSP1171-20130828/465_1 /TAXON_ID=374046 /ORGANISM="Helicotheca tamensis, Strain CCMP826" /LENGTH=104 /DNA_ID=CAMNT_0028391461 /DNA_START=56 /DNA_END=370 /DNA_ORIENTATION=+
MVKVWYEPPPFGPRTSLSKGPYGVSEAQTARWIVAASKAPQWQVITAFTGIFACLAYIPLLKEKLPYTCSPEYLAAQRAYMRYHNMNPIWGISSKKARAADAGH